MGHRLDVVNWMEAAEVHALVHEADLHAAAFPSTGPVAGGFTVGREVCYIRRWGNSRFGVCNTIHPNR